MTSGQRRIHRIAWTALTVLLPALIAISVLARHSPRNNNGIRWEEFR